MGDGCLSGAGWAACKFLRIGARRAARARGAHAWHLVRGSGSSGRWRRLARSGIRDTFEVVEELRAAGVEVVRIADGFSLDGPAADVILAVMAWAAKMERLAIGERIAAARERIEAEGGRWGRPHAIDRATLARARDACRGRTIREVAVALKVKRSTLARALVSP